MVTAGITLRAQAGKQIHPASGNGGAIVILVLGDNFAASEELDFNEAAENFFLHGLLTDPYYAAHKGALTIKTTFEPVSSKPSSTYGFELGASAETNCSIQWDQNGVQTSAVLEERAKDAAATKVVVLGNYNYNFGCAQGDWVYLGVGAVGQQTLHHEMGHLIGGLFDEFAAADHVTHSHPDAPIEKLNCSTNTAAPHWSFPGLPHCDLYGVDIVHPTNTCRMGVHGTEFCSVCKPVMDTELACGAHPESCAAEDPNASLDPSHAFPAFSRTMSELRVSAAGLLLTTATTQPTDARILRLMLRLDRKPGNALTIVTANDSTGRYLSRHRRLGDYVYEVTDRGTTLAIGVIPGNPFRTRAYSGGGSQHRASDRTTADVLVTIPGETRNTILADGRAVEIAFYRLTAQAGNQPITPGRLALLRKSDQATPHARVLPTELRAFLQNQK
jgi:hypothetical protein